MRNVPTDLKDQTKADRGSRCKYGSSRQPYGFDRPGRMDALDARYREGKTHEGKTTTLRDHRKGRARLV